MQPLRLYLVDIDPASTALHLFPREETLAGEPLAKGALFERTPIVASAGDLDGDGLMDVAVGSAALPCR